MVSRAARDTTRSTAQPAVEQAAQDGRGVRRAGGPTTPTIHGPACLDPTPAAAVSPGAQAQPDNRSSTAKTNSAMPTKPFTVKKARLTRDRSSA